MTQNNPKKLGRNQIFRSTEQIADAQCTGVSSENLRAGTVDQEQVLDFITQRVPRSPEQKAWPSSTALVRALAHFLALGYHVKLPFADFRPTVQGRIDNRETGLKPMFRPGSLCHRESLCEASSKM